MDVNLIVTGGLVLQTSIAAGLALKDWADGYDDDEEDDDADDTDDE